MIKSSLVAIKNFFIGLFESIEDAQMKRAEAARKYFHHRWD